MCRLQAVRSKRESLVVHVTGPARFADCAHCSLRIAQLVAVASEQARLLHAGGLAAWRGVGSAVAVAVAIAVAAAVAVAVAVAAEGHCGSCQAAPGTF